MKQPPLAIVKIEQIDNHTLGITWSDQLRHEYLLYELQQKCPCAQCNVDGEKKIIDKNVRAVKIQSVGRYALKIQFTSGCSKGIYTYPYLHRLFQEKIL